jgi:putative acetyltransferase
LEIRSARASDRPGTLRAVRQAFGTGGRDGQEEVDIVEAVWTLGAAGARLELVATVDGVLAGHVLGSWGDLDGSPVIGVAPLAVSPSHQGAGIGGALMVELIRRAEDLELPLLVLLGDPAYYERFGFEPSGPLGIFYGPAGWNSPHFQVRRLARYTPAFRGEYRYCWEISRPS